VKKYWWLEILVTVALAGTGLAGIRHFRLPLDRRASWTVLGMGLVGFLALTLWTLGVQRGYALIRGRDYAESLTRSLAKEYVAASPIQALLGGITAALGEELFFRGFLQGRWGLAAGALAFGLAHVGRKDIRVVSAWAFVHGLIIGLCYRLSGNILVPMIAHGLFDTGGVVYFRRFMEARSGSGAA
jgi:membrane protease YdiL (CAAX protease family)